MNLISPYTPKSNVYKGSIHFHTTESDGNKTPTEAMTFYKEKGYDFASITDHNLATADPEVADILFILGEEYSNPNYKKPHNVWVDVGETQWVGLAHPLSTDTGTPTLSDLEQYLPDYEHVAVWNTVEDENYETVIDHFLSLGYQFNIYSEDDSHSYGANMGLSGVYVYADSLSKTEIMTNLHAGNYYSFSGGDISDLNISVSGTVINVSVGDNSTIEFITLDGVVSETFTNSKTASFIVRGGDVYCRVRVTRDSDGAVAWSNPIFVDKN